jgi:hypothetical protein
MYIGIEVFEIQIFFRKMQIPSKLGTSGNRTRNLALTGRLH